MSEISVFCSQDCSLDVTHENTMYIGKGAVNGGPFLINGCNVLVRACVVGCCVFLLQFHYYPRG